MNPKLILTIFKIQTFSRFFLCVMLCNNNESKTENELTANVNWSTQQHLQMRPTATTAIVCCCIEKFHPAKSSQFSNQNIIARARYIHTMRIGKGMKLNDLKKQRAAKITTICNQRT